MPKYEVQVQVPQVNRENYPRGPTGPPEVDDEEANATLLFEMNSIKKLQDERVYIQEKTFTKWCNSFLSQARLEITNLFSDLGDGILLMKLLEIISGEKLGKPNRGKLRVQKVENLNKSLDFLKRKRIQLENIGAEDILDGNERLILGLIWTIILRFQIDTISLPMDEETGERKYAKEALLLWCQRKTADYPNVKVENFTTSWRNGLAFNALIHAHRPDLISFDSLSGQDPIGNLNNAFDIAEKKLEIPRLLDAEDVNVNHPDEKSIITYVSLFYHCFAKQKTELTGARRVAKIVGNLMSVDQLQEEYETLCSELLEWIRQTVVALNDRRFPNSLAGMKEEVARFNAYRTVEKPPKYKEKGDLEALFFTIQTKRKAMKRSPYVPPQGLLMHDIETEWNVLDHAESERQSALIAEAARQERLENIAKKFERKAELRESWLKDMGAVLSDFDFGRTAGEVEASMKKQQAITAEILPREVRFKSLSKMAADLAKEKYHNSDKIRARDKEILDKWTQLLANLEARRVALMSLNDLMGLLRDIDTLSSEIQRLQPQFLNRDVGRHLLGVEDLLEKHEILEAQLNSQGELLKNITAGALQYIRGKGEQYDVLQRKLDDVSNLYNSVADLCRQRRLALLRARDLYRFIQDYEEEMSWLKEKNDVCSSLLANHDLSVTPQLSRLFKHLETEMHGHWQRTKTVIAIGERLMANGQNKDDIEGRIQQLYEKWEQLRKAAEAVAKWLHEAEAAHQYFQDANEAESWIREKMPLVKSDDYGRDEQASANLLQRHARLEEEIQAYRSDIIRLEEMADELAKSDFVVGTAVQVIQDTTELKVPQVRMLYPFKGNNVSVKKDEILALIEKSNEDWWRILKQDGTEGYIPANYCKIVDGETVTVSQTTTVRKPEARDSANKSHNIVTERQEAISADYRKLNNLAQRRRKLLSDMVSFYKFLRECDQFETWANEAKSAFADDITSEDVHALRKKFDKIDRDIATSGKAQLKRINTMADELLAEGHSHSPEITRHQDTVNRLWNDLNKLRDAKLAQLETAERVSSFNEACEDARSWMRDKFDLLNTSADTSDPNASRALQRRYQNLGKDLKPLDEKIRGLRKLANEVRMEHPEEAKRIDATIKELEALHADLQRNAAAKIEEAEQSQGTQMFDNAAKALLNWAAKTKAQLTETPKPVNVASAEELLKRHYELSDDIASKKYEFDYVRDLGQRLLQKNPSLAKVKGILRDLEEERQKINGMWKDKERVLKEMLDLQLFNTEAERIDAATKGHEDFLKLSNLGDSVESVENLLKRHSDFEAKLKAQEDRLRAFSNTAEQLISAGHSDSSYIKERQTNVLNRRRAVHSAAASRRAQLEASLIYQKLRQNVTELSQWIADKKRIANDDAHKDIASLHLKRLKHDAFEAELKANAERIEQVNQEGKALIASGHYESPAIKQLLSKLNSDWDDLCRAADAKRQRLDQAGDQKNLNAAIDDVHQKLDEVSNSLTSKDLGNDLRGVKTLLKKQDILEQEMTQIQQKITELSRRGDAMARQGHFDAPNIQKVVTKLQDKFESWKRPVCDRRVALEESLKWHKLSFDIDCEMQWIAEKESFASSIETGQSLTDTLNLQKKHEQLEAEVNSHSAQIHSTLKEGDALIKQKHFAADAIEQKCEKLRVAWDHLNELIRQRKDLLDWALKEKQYMFDAAEIESWLQDKRLLLSSNDYGQDEDAAQKLLTKHKALQTDMAAYKQWLEKLSVKCGDLTKSASPSDRDKFLKRQKELEDEFDAINKLAEDRRRQLENAVLFYQYMRESEELESWINEQLQMAISEDYGEDYEHLKELQARFEEFKEGVKTGTQRFVHCENAANALLKRNPPFARDILKRQEKLRSVWNLLLDYIESRDEKLKAAEELHAFNRDVAEKQERIAEMHSSIPSELGKDIKQVHALWLKHEAFENQLGAMEGELDKLMEESARLKLAYPGGNAEHITLQQTAISDGWHDLQDATIVRRDLLKASYDLQRFYVNARDLIAWADVMITDMHSEPVVHDLQGAEWLKKDHERLRAEIDSREPEFLRISELGQQMIDKDHYAKADIAVKIKQVLAALDRVHKEWENRRNWLSEICEWHAFQREAKQTLASIAARRKTLRLTQVGESVEEVENQLRKLDTFQKALSGIDDRVAALEKSGADLIGKKHMNSDQIKELLNKVKTELVELRNGMNDRRLELMDALKLAKFNSSVADMDGWIEEKIKRIRMETDKQAKLTSIEDKMRRLQKHQAMEAELEANAPRVEEIRQMLKERASLPGVNRAEVVKKSEEVLSRWEKLTSMSRDQSSALEEARDLLNFNQMVERIMQWIKEKELLVSAGDMGRDMEHCQMLMDKLQGKDADASVDDSTVQAANDLGRKLISQGRSSQKDVQDQLTNLNKAWKDLKGKLNAYRSQLNAAIEVHAFNRDVDDTIDRINEKVSLVANDDVGKDLPTVEALIRKQEAVKRDMTVIHDKLKIHDEEAQKLLKKDVPLRDTMVESLRKLEASWRKLAEMAADRDAALARSLELQRYFDATRKADTWANEMRDSLLATETAPTTSGVEELIAKHKDKLAEIDGRQKDTADFHEWGNKLIAEQPEHKIIVQKTLKRLQIIEHQLRQAWETKNTSLSRQRDLQQFTDQADRVEQWLATKEAFLKQADVGDSVEAANEHLKKHDDFEKSLLAQSEKIDNLKKEADHLAKKDAEHSHEIQQRKDAVVARYNAVIEACKNRRLHLIESRKLHEFIDSCGDLMQWISANIQLAYDETFLDQTNLRSKLRKHLAFEAELDANEERVRTIIDAGEKLIAEKHSASEDIALQIEEVKKGWQELRSKSAMKKQRLREANEAYQLNRRLEDLEKWVERVENDLSSEDHGKDLVSVEAIIKKQDDLEAEIKSRQDIVKETVEKAREFEKQVGINFS
ncbi:hypothetical protein AB6A40_001839 [Gnathostoma spinigerum]|uniref:Spectrin beta chain n=1 Tax=Gnathostoma spinigerum TaxID=75299 RepID=A0ABD6E648_9BILA